MRAEKSKIISQLQQDILHLQGFKPGNGNDVPMGLDLFNDSFPNRTFPLGAVHEFISAGKENTAATSGFIAGLLSPLMRRGGTSLWISSSRNLFPPALKNFGIEPDRFVFIDLQNEKHVAWAMEEALKCSALTAVIGEMQEITFTVSRRLQLAVENSKVTGFILRRSPQKMHPTACVSRWRITPNTSENPGQMPGIGFPCWKIELLRIRNGRTGAWEVKWEGGQFQQVNNLPPNSVEQQWKTG